METFQDRAQLMKSIGPGGLCAVDGRVQKLVRFDEAARIYEFTNSDGSSWWTTGDEAFEKGVCHLSPLPGQ